MARILIVGGGCRGRLLASELVSEGHLVRITTRAETGRAAIEAVGAEAWIGTPDRLATLRGALDRVAVLCWLLGTARGPREELQALHSSRLEFFLTQAIDTTVRGIVYESTGVTPSAGLVERGAQIAERLTRRNSIPARFLTAGPRDASAWLGEANRSVGSLL